MAHTIYASFADAGLAEKAAGALLDHGVRNEDISIVAHRPDGGEDRTDTAAKQGISTTTPGDAGAGAAKGAGIGLGVGVVAALASMMVPGFGLVMGGGALATAIAGAAGATAAGAVAGGVHGYLKDQGMPDEAIMRYENAWKAGGAIMAVTVPSGNMDQKTVEGILCKYQASNVDAFGMSGTDWNASRFAA